MEFRCKHIQGRLFVWGRCLLQAQLHDQEYTAKIRNTGYGGIHVFHMCSFWWGHFQIPAYMKYGKTSLHEHNTLKHCPRGSCPVNVCVCVCYMCAGTHGDHKRAFAPLELKSQEVMSRLTRMLETKLRSSAETARSLNPRDLSSPPNSLPKFKVLWS